MTRRVLRNLMLISLPQIGARSHQLADPVAEHGERDFLTVGLAPEERFGELRRLIQGHLGWKRRLERIDHALYDHRAWRRQRFLEHAAAVGRVVDRESGGAAGPREQREVHRLQLAAVLGIAEED